MKHTSLALSLSAALLAVSTLAHADVAEAYQRGPDPTTASLEAAAGPFRTASTVLQASEIGDVSVQPQ